MAVPLIGEILDDGVTLAVLPDGGNAAEAAYAAATLQTLTPNFKKAAVPGALVTGLSWATCVQLSHTFGDYWRPQPRLVAWLQAQVIARTSRQPMVYEPPAGMTPYWWQREGADLIAATGRALITDEPGTGKTGTAVLGLVEWAARSHAEGPVVVVCPASVIDSWVREWKMWAPHVRAVAWRGPNRKKLAGTADVYVTSYDTARLDAPEVSMMAALLALEPGALIVDECHFIKNGQARRTKAVLRIASAVQKRGGAVVGLSGTPITRDTGDIHPMLKALDEPAWPNKERMIGRYCMTVQGDYDEKILGLEPTRAAEFHLCLLGQHRRIAKADVLPDLPDKVYSIRTVELPAKWRKVYDDFEASMFAEMPDGTELSVFDEMSAYTHRSALSSAPGTVEVTFGPEVDEDTGLPKRHVSIKLNEYDPTKADGGSWKVSALLEILAERGGPKACKPTIVFAPSRQLVEIAGKAAAHQGYRVGYVVGGQSAKVRTADVDAFQAGQLDVICVTTQAGGVGLTLTAADAIVVLQRPWALDESIQLEDRAHRIGAAHESLQIIDIVAKKTIDGRRRESLPEKARHLAEFVQDERVVDQLLGGKDVREHQPTTTPRELISA